MSKSRSRLLPIVVIAAAVVAAAFVLNPSPERHRERIKAAVAERSGVARVLGLGSLVAFASNYHSLGVASYTKAGDRTVSIGFMGFVFVPQ
ncbi:hypothetical protein HHL11_15950 [Ramlibacter sp. G-1-2-2]|uniref:DUF4359 domain-containing protein n=1 Tax=Ramlibacter agri TaxID=2728837 RepID=A0A848HCH7_9BURK|nr:hypothetical protein [Ramlibacter agri]NML45248.1 hypothetical protein [Ramlibacter agri]